ncbi:hypothetical protein ABZ208_26805 [Streptomyces sp. NPDC006208]|uniref:hypothetical protein n=1 Tax=Streptomyces sp. NPDC006208 TaxID=3156734 RepID=UPI0033A24A9F
MPPDSEHAVEAFARSSLRKPYRTAYLLCGNADTARDLTRTTLAGLCRHWRRGAAAGPALLDLVRYADEQPTEQDGTPVKGG